MDSSKSLSQTSPLSTRFPDRDRPIASAVNTRRGTCLPLIGFCFRLRSANTQTGNPRTLKYRGLQVAVVVRRNSAVSFILRSTIVCVDNSVHESFLWLKSFSEQFLNTIELLWVWYLKGKTNIGGKCNAETSVKLKSSWIDKAWTIKEKYVNILFKTNKNDLSRRAKKLLA